MRRAVLLNGVPASGKSTVGRLLVKETGWPYLALDTIKEALFDELGFGDRAYNRKLGLASYRAMFGLAADFAEDAVFLADAWFGFQPADVLRAHLDRAKVGAFIEIWCHAPAEAIAARYRARIGQRHTAHPGESYVPELIDLVGRAAPMRLGPVIDVDTTQALDGPGLAASVRKALGAPN